MPFDIRQQRCIHYELHEDDPKAAARKELASLLRVRIDEILENGLRNLKGSGPKLTTSWNYMDCTKDLQEGIAADCLELTRGDPIVNVSPEAMSEFLTMKTVTGSFDPNWGEKMTAYKADLDKFEKDMEDSEKRLNFSIMGNLGKVVCATVVVENIGNKPATEIRAKFEIPDWLHVFEELPDKSDTPQTPVPPEPSLPKYASAPKSFSQLGKVSGLSDHLGNLITQNINKSSGCYLRKSNIHFWAAQLLHKHEIYSSDDQIYFFVETDAPVGEYVVEGTIFCSEYDDWRDCELLIKIK